MDPRRSKRTISVIDFCWNEEADSCGPGGECILQRTGNRCICPDGFMGKACQRPCQDIYNSCERWLQEKRCEWAKPISPFFFDNCPLSCGRCKAGSKKLKTPLPPILEPLSWIIGRWKTRTSTKGYRFPVSLDSGYEEVLDFAITEVPSFDRPPLSVTVRASPLNDKSVEHQERGFMTVKPFREDTGFVVKNKPKSGDDLVAIESVSNNGLIIIEEGRLLPREIRLSVVFKRSILPRHSADFHSADRSFHLISEHLLEERTRMELTSGATLKFRKRYVKIFDYFTDYATLADASTVP